jgi:hypothetical protein
VDVIEHSGQAAGRAELVLNICWIIGEYTSTHYLGSQCTVDLLIEYYGKMRRASSALPQMFRLTCNIQKHWSYSSTRKCP